MTNENKLVSIILVNYNCMKYMKGLLESLRIQSYHPLEVLVFDNGSTDGSLEHLCENYPTAQVFKMGHNTGFSRPNNLGIQRSKGDYILTLNCDVVLEKDFIEQMVRGIESDKTIGWATGRLLRLTPNGKSEQIDTLGHYLTRDRHAKGFDTTIPFSWDDYSQPRFVFGASACAALYRKEMLEDISINGEYYDEDFFAYNEDVDLDWRAQLRGWKCRYVPAAVGYHERFGSGLIRNPYIISLRISNRIFMIIKNDSFSHAREDIVQIIQKGVAEVKENLTSHPWAVVSAFFRMVRLFPRMYRKRRRIQSGRAVPPDYMRSLIR